MIRGAFRLFVLALVPMLVMIVPVLLLLGQLSLWYQPRPLRVGEEAVVALKLSGEPRRPDARRGPRADRRRRGRHRPGPRPQPARGRAGSSRPRENGIASPLVPGGRADRHEGAGGRRRLHAGQPPPRPAGTGTTPCSTRPSRAFRASTRRSSRSRSPTPTGRRGPAAPTTGSIYWFVVSMVAAFCAKPFLKVNM